jgi:hypothetical protein
MRSLRVLASAALIASAIGCGLIDKIGGGGKKPSGTPVQQVSAAQLVDYLNTQASRLESITYDRVNVTPKQGIIPLPSLRGDLAAVQPRNFRMRGQGGMANAKIDLGSNDEQFWLYVNAPTTQPTFVFASHSDFETGKARLPEGIPFDPDWVMQALGMIKFPQNASYDQVKLDDKGRTYTLSWPATTPAGMPIRKEIVFAADDADSSRDQPQVKKHTIRDARGRVICTAEVKRAKTVAVGGNDPRTGNSFVAQYPTHIVLRWEDQRFEMDLELNGGKLNPQLTPEQLRSHFSRPNFPGTPVVNLAEARFEGTKR